MLTQLPTLKSRLALTTTDYDDLLTAAIAAVSDRSVQIREIRIRGHVRKMTPLPFQYQASRTP